MPARITNREGYSTDLKTGEGRYVGFINRSYKYGRGSERQTYAITAWTVVDMATTPSTMMKM